jgi:NAD(P)-dependent dehydrogenase (short-subunit alcohol dehydrogenase family)
VERAAQHAGGAGRVSGSVMVTGASSGIGAAIATELAARGFTVGCLSRRGTSPPGERLLGLKADVSDENASSRALAELVDRAGPLTGLVNGAGFTREAPSADLPAETLRSVLETNFVAAFVLSRLAYPHLKQAGGGLIVNIGSFFDHLGVPHNVPYAASKAALASMTRCLAVEWAKDGIRLLNVAPGYVLTDLNREFFSEPRRRESMERRIPVRRLGEIEEVARLVACLYAEPVGFLTGETIYVDGGQGMSL